ncbi:MULTISPECIES: ABC transporter permease [Rhodobacterales]|jgi:peptide/nickel transport system permease protein|uniref:ABC transporter permease n=1 Tax=Rhodobacterales TaxID=204455 RepID=UPI00237F7B43|nr:ABC transporter permease [Phaeobacter gallaeciensis]MDE4139461.1 ABC transporter permease [Phaeobacter gallaeciensis]MDE4147481.1 ABC transporter permease [Phaeobacter gallaeciensis]MDE4151700.1 ABC transporter permease [Phaeobacter gallaeciensis]MDE4227516.1 ABC transporter permease [Phaeobacter gallaeciensis]MDE4256164.1 ABC transporter permease [Phaeobacter gallaeciensis]
MTTSNTYVKRQPRLPLPAWLRGVLVTLLSISITMLGLLFVTFVIGRVMPIDPVLAVVGERATEAQYDAVFVELGLDKPLIVQFFYYVSDVLRGDFGTSLLTARPVADDIVRVFPATFELATIGILFGCLLGVPLGVVAAVKRGSWIDQIARVVALVGYSMPIFWLGLMGLLLFYGILGWVGGPGRQGIFYEDMIPVVTGMILLDSILAGDWGAFWDAFSHIVLPASILGYYSLAYISRMTRSFMLEQLSAEYVTTARVKGMSEWAVVWHHAFRNIRVQLITVIALSYANLLEGSVLTEIIFSWPGIGSYITTALLSADMNAVLGGTVVVGLVFICLNVFSDLLYKVFDPRSK